MAVPFRVARAPLRVSHPPTTCQKLTKPVQSCNPGPELATWLHGLRYRRAQWPPRSAPCACPGFRTSDSPIWSTSSATGSARSRSRSWSSTRPGSPMATAALFCGMHFVPAVLGPPLVARLESAARPAQPARPLRRRGDRVRRPRADRRGLRAHRGARHRDDRRLDRVGRPRAHPDRRDRHPRPGGTAARGQRAAQRRLHASARPAARRSPGSSSPAPGSRSRCSPTRSPSWPSPRSCSPPAASRLPESEEPEASLDDAPTPRPRLRARATRAAPSARRPGARVHLLRARDPDRGRVREGDPRRR